MTEQALLRWVMDRTDEGIICVNADAMITQFNQKAKEITGIVLENRRSHPAGQLVPGDIVLISDNIMGCDDGYVTPEDLEQIGIYDLDLHVGDALLAAGVYQRELSPLCRHWAPHAVQRELCLEGYYQGLELRLGIDQEEKLLCIRVNGTDYNIRYLESMANVVVVDGVTGTVKFYQDKGCTMRREDLGDLLAGHSFQPKGEGTAQLDVIGRDFFDLVQPGDLTNRMDRILSGAEGEMVNKSIAINKRLMLGSLYPFREDGVIRGALLKITDLSEMGVLLRERNALIAKVEEASLNIDNYTGHVPTAAFSTFAGSSPPIQRVKYLAYKAAMAQCNVIITGESGTGKSQLSREIHQIARPGRPFVEVNCSSIPRDLFESELFGYVAGAFTGALSGGKPGYFELADQGTLFLDEIAEIPPHIQVKLLYVLQNRRFYRVGATKPTGVDVRILCATNKDLAEEMRQGRFREDLYYRVNVFPIEIPPLRARISDIYLLSRSITESICANYGIPPKQLSGKALEKLLHYDWPGNIRELGNVIERAIAVCESSIISADYISPEGFSTEGENDFDAPLGQSLRAQLEYAEAHILREALREAGGDKKQAMKQLGLKKTTFYEKLHVYHLL